MVSEPSAYAYLVGRESRLAAFVARDEREYVAEWWRSWSGRFCFEVHQSPGQTLVFRRLNDGLGPMHHEHCHALCDGTDCNSPP